MRQRIKNMLPNMVWDGRRRIFSAPFPGPAVRRYFPADQGPPVRGDAQPLDISGPQNIIRVAIMSIRIIRREQRWKGYIIY